MEMGANLLLSNVTKLYKTFKAVDDVSININKGEFLTILGPSGSGKTSLLKLIAGFEKINSGEILLNKDNIESKKPYERNIGMLFQNYALFPHMTVFQNIAYPLKIRKYSKVDIKKKVTELLKLVDLENVEERYPKQLSGGQQQRVALARAIVFNPPLLLLDEPLGALDKNLRQKMQLEIKHIQQKVGITTISVTHDQEEALTMSDKVCIMNKGKVEQIDTPERIYQRPKTRFVAEFIGEINMVNCKILRLEEEVAYVKAFDDNEIKVIIDHDSDYCVGQDMLLVFRPENIAIIKDVSEWENSCKASIKEIIFVGDTLKVKVAINKGIEVMIKASPSIKDTLSIGNNIILGWDSNNCTIIKD